MSQDLFVDELASLIADLWSLAAADQLSHKTRRLKEEKGTTRRSRRVENFDW